MHFSLQHAHDVVYFGKYHIYLPARVRYENEVWECEN